MEEDHQLALLAWALALVALAGFVAVYVPW